jgi:hypothetical protein
LASKKERKELARKERMQAQKRAARARRNRRIYTLLVLLAIAGAIFGLVAISGKNSRKAGAKLTAALTAAGCSAVQNPADQGQGHIAPPKTFQYNSNPPTSGQHYASANPQAPAATGVHTTPIQNEAQVHNLEHGQTGVQYTDGIDPAVKAALETIGKDASYNTLLFVAPKPDLPSGVTLAISAWDHFTTCTKPTDPTKTADLVKAWAAFYKGKSPEGFIAGTPGA